jgi:nicotinate dehydrogenase subunit B
MPSDRTTALPRTDLSRRALLAGGGALIVSFALAPVPAGAQTPPALAELAKSVLLPGSLNSNPVLESWIKVAADGSVTVFSGKSELGQGIRTALVQVAAEQLGLPFEDVRLITSDTAQTPNEGYTSGSQSMSDGGIAIQHAAAQVREILIRLAAEKLSFPADGLQAKGGVILAPDGRRIGFGELVADRMLALRAEPTSKLNPPASYTLVGQSIPRVDIPAKVSGAASYVHDMRLEGMLHARVVRPPSYDARLVGVDTVAIEKMPGVKKVMVDGRFLAIVADDEFRAIKAMEALGAAATWQEAASLPERARISEYLKGLPKRVFTIRDDKAVAGVAVKTLEAEYTRPYHMHASIGPSCAVASFTDGQMTVWSHAQGMFPLRQAVSELLKLPLDKVRCIHVAGAGCYGHNGADDAAADAALIAFAVPGVPIRLQWMREQEHTWEPYGAAMVMKVKASLDPDGRIVAWGYDVWTNTHSMRPGGAGATLAGQLKAESIPVPPPQLIPQPAGGGDRNIIPLYKIPNLHLNHNFIPDMPVRVSALRGLGAYANVFAIESFMDELAAAAGADPVAFRLKHLEDPRARDVVALAAEKFGWTTAPMLTSGRGRGFAFAKYKNLAGYCALAIELEVEHETGRVRLIRAIAAAESGQAVNPDGIKNQIAGGIVQSASWTLHEAVDFDQTRILSRDWSSYPILRFSELFETLEVHVISRPGLPFLGTGEASQGPTGAAIANAVFNATGRRVRDLPLNATRIKQTIGV